MKGDIVSQQKSMNNITKEQTANIERISDFKEAFFQNIQDVKSLLEDKIHAISTEANEQGFRLDT